MTNVNDQKNVESPKEINVPAAKTNSAPGEARQILLKEVGSKWDKLSEQDLSAMKDKGDIVTQVVAKYGIEKAQAHRDVEALLKGRPF